MLTSYQEKRKALVKACEELSDLEDKIAKLYKEIVKANLAGVPILQQIDDMEKKIVKEIEKSFKKIKAKFMRYNPFKELREPIKEKLEQTMETLQTLDGGTSESFSALKSLCCYENKIVYEVADFIREVNAKIEMNKLANPLLDSDFLKLSHQYGKLSEKIIRACASFSDDFSISV